MDFLNIKMWNSSRRRSRGQKVFHELLVNDELK